MSYAIGSLVRARGREWVVLPNDDPDILLLRPLGGADDEQTGIHLGLESVEPASFQLPTPEQIGDYQSAKLLRDAIRLGFRSSAGPFRSFARIAVAPRPYQFVPLLMALKLDPVRMLIADDVGIGKTIEAGLIARELLDRGEIRRIAVLCPPPLAEQWQAELRDKFYIDAELVLPNTVSRLERRKRIRMGESLFEHYPFVVVSTDFIKSDRRRDEFLRTAPEFIIIDEAHTVVNADERIGNRHQRFKLVSGLAENPARHMLFVTATPHSGKETAFRSLLGLIRADFADLPEDLSGRENEAIRRELAQYFVQRRRADIRSYLDLDTPFPDRQYTEATYRLSRDYKALFERVLDYARETVLSPLEGFQQRVRWWSVLALLSALASSPAAAMTTLRNRALAADATSAEEADTLAGQAILDLIESESAEGIDVPPGADDGLTPDTERGRLHEMATLAESLQGTAKDHKLAEGIKLVKTLLADGYSPIVFCRFIPTVDYLTAEIRRALPGVEVVGVTGLLPPGEREQRVAQLAAHPRRVLVCTDCLSEGVNLQKDFNAVIHYDLSWNPTRHEQREGRIDRYGQPRSTVKVVTYYGTDNQIDGVILDVLLNKHKAIRDSLGISVPLPGDISQVVEAIFGGLLLRDKAQRPAAYANQMSLFGPETGLPSTDKLSLQWENAKEREKRSRTVFAQQTIRVEEVKAELRAAQEAVGSGVDLQEFMVDTARLHKATVSLNGVAKFDFTESPRGLRDSLGGLTHFTARFELPVQGDERYLTRTHPLVEALATYVMDSALDPDSDPEQAKARRCGVIRTMQVATRTTLLLLRLRYHLITKRGGREYPLMVEDSLVLAFEGAPESARWLDHAAAERLLRIRTADDNTTPQQAATFVQRVTDGFAEHLAPHLDEIAVAHGDRLLEAHRRVRTAARQMGIRYEITPQLPPDVLGIYVFLPVRAMP